MKRFLLISTILVSFAACGKGESAVTAENLKLSSLDVVYASQDDFMHNGQQLIQDNVDKLQSVLKIWPTQEQSNQSPCYMQLKIHTVRMLGLLDGLRAEKDERESDFRYDCRQSINYQYDQARSHELWVKL